MLYCDYKSKQLAELCAYAIKLIALERITNFCKSNSCPHLRDSFKDKEAKPTILAIKLTASNAYVI